MADHKFNSYLDGVDHFERIGLTVVGPGVFPKDPAHYLVGILGYRGDFVFRSNVRQEYRDRIIESLGSVREDLPSE